MNILEEFKAVDQKPAAQSRKITDGVVVFEDFLMNIALSFGCAEHNAEYWWRVPHLQPNLAVY